jgi:hypothetical protein
MWRFQQTEDLGPVSALQGVFVHFLHKLNDDACVLDLRMNRTSDGL